jgi:hypothetical protein
MMRAGHLTFSRDLLRLSARILKMFKFFSLVARATST